MPDLQKTNSVGFSLADETLVRGCPLFHLGTLCQRCEPEVTQVLLVSRSRLSGPLCGWIGVVCLGSFQSWCLFVIDFNRPSQNSPFFTFLPINTTYPKPWTPPPPHLQPETVCLA